MMESCKNCMHHAPQAENEFMCSNELSPSFGLNTNKDDYCMEYSEDVRKWNLADGSAV